MTQDITAQDERKVATRFKRNVVKINTVFANGSDENGFGTVIAERNNKLYIVTAKHVIQDTRYQSKTTAVKVYFFSEPNKSYPGLLLNLPGGSSSLDIGLIEVEKPTRYNWRNKFYSNSLKDDAKVVFIGRTGQWYIPTIPGRVNEISTDQITVDISSVQPGCSGAPLLSSDGMVGLIFADDKDVAKAYPIRKVIEVVRSTSTYPWQIRLNEQNQEVHVGYVIASFLRTISNIFNTDEKISDYLGAFSLGYRYELKKRWAVGGTIVIERFDLSTDTSPDDRMNAFSIMPDGRYYYITNKRFKLYSGINAGVVLVDTKEDNSSTWEAGFAFHVNLIGVRVGRKLGAFCELGAGYRGAVNLGASFRFSDF